MFIFLFSHFLFTFRQAQGRLEIVGRGSLKIYSANEADSGTYTCRAENLLDSDDSDASLIVLGRCTDMQFCHILKQK